LKIRCLHGYFIFEETRSGEVSEFASLFKIDLVAKNNYFTFETLKDAPKYSLAGGTYLGAAALKTFEGEPWEVMKENSLVYDFLNDELKQISSVTQRIELSTAANYYLANGLILPGSLMDGGSRVMDYSARYLFDSNKFRYSEVTDV
jgi:hypothetical protein